MGDGGHRSAATAAPTSEGRGGYQRQSTDALRRLGAAKHLSAGGTLFRQGDGGTTVYLLERGVVRLTVDAGKHAIAVSTAWPGDLVGAVDALAGQPRGATATAATECCLIAVAGNSFADAVDRDARLRRCLLLQMSAELAAAHGRLVSQLSQNTVVRVAATLLALSGDHGVGGRTVRTTQSALAEWIGATRESTARALAELRHEGLITTGRGWIRLDDREALAKLAAC